VKRLFKGEAYRPYRLRYISEQARIIEELRFEVESLKKNSRNSSKPPSSDIVKAPLEKLSRKKKRKIGAQKGHIQHIHNLFPSSQVDKVIKHELPVCPKCQGALVATANVKKFQQVKLVAKPIFVTEHQQQEYWCATCQKFHTAPLPSAVRREGFFNSDLTALVGYLKGACHLSFGTIQRFFNDMLSIKISTGFLNKQIQKVSQSLEAPYQELRKRLQFEKYVHSDETGWLENGVRFWVWTLRGSDFSVFRIGSRGSKELFDLLGEDFSGTIVCDFFPAYRKFSKETETQLQFCWAHLIREIKFISEKSLAEPAVYGQRLLRETQAMFHTIHRKDKLPESQWQQRMFCHREKLMKLSLFEGNDNDCLLIMKRFQQYGDDYFRFIETGIPPTNNLAEQTIRRVVLDRHVTPGNKKRKRK
jgi:transposase